MPLRNPGSPEARAQGCTCSPLQNRNGVGAGTNGRGEPMFIPAKRCPLHGDEKYRREEVA